jgi:hypothetical protein
LYEVGLNWAKTFFSQFAFSAKIIVLQPIFEALILFMTAGNEIVSIEQPSAPLSFYQFALPTTQTRSSNAVRNPGLFMVLEKCFQV